MQVPVPEVPASAPEAVANSLETLNSVKLLSLIPGLLRLLLLPPPASTTSRTYKLNKQ